MKIEIAVIIPFLNEAGNLLRCAESVINQSFRELEIILVNDASTDSSELEANEIIVNYPKRKIALVSHESNQGLGPSRNTGLKHTRAKYIMFLDADDWLESERSVEIAYNIVSNGKADLGVFNHLLYYENNVFERNPAGAHLTRAKRSKSNLIKSKVFLLRNHHVAWNKIYTRDLLKRAGPYPPGSYEDIPVSYACLFFADKIAIIEQPLVCYRQRKGTSHAASQLKPKSVKHFDVFDRYDQVFKTIDEAKVPEALAQEAFRRMLLQFVSTYHAKGRVRKEDRQLFFSRIRESVNRFSSYSDKPLSLQEGIIRFLISKNCWRIGFVTFRLYALIKNSK